MIMTVQTINSSSLSTDSKCFKESWLYSTKTNKSFSCVIDRILRFFDSSIDHSSMIRLELLIDLMLIVPQTYLIQ